MSTTPTKEQLPPFVFRPAASSTTTVPLDQVVKEAVATTHEPLKHRSADHAIVISDNKHTANKNLVGAWAALMNLGRKGDAEKIRQIGIANFGEKEFEGAISTAISSGTGDSPVKEEIAAAGFARVEVSTAREIRQNTYANFRHQVASELQDPSGDDRETAKRCLAAAAQAFGDMRKQGVAEKIAHLFENAFGKTLEEYNA